MSPNLGSVYEGGGGGYETVVHPEGAVVIPELLVVLEVGRQAEVRAHVGRQDRRDHHLSDLLHGATTGLDRVHDLQPDRSAY